MTDAKRIWYARTKIRIFFLRTRISNLGTEVFWAGRRGTLSGFITWLCRLPNPLRKQSQRS
jgi:hypothetical protein